MTEAFTRKDKKNIELLAPAGNFERMKFAIHYGADAVYCGSKDHSLRAFADNFTTEELFEAVQYAHERAKRVYVTLNAFMRNSDVDMLPEYIRGLVGTNIDALIVTDPAALCIARECAPNVEVHLSTQANTLNYRAVRFWSEMGARRIILARELPLDEIKRIKDEAPDIELEAFVHGAMCISYSGRCLLSSAIDGRDGNRGQCVQPCRWGYEIREMGKDGEYYPIEQDGHGTYVLNSRDLNMLDHIGDLIDAGVTSLKIEGRMKTAYYVACVTNAYRAAIDAALSGISCKELWADELTKIRHRPYCTGFYFGNEVRESQGSNAYIQTHEFVGVVHNYDSNARRALVEQRNRFFVGDTLEIMSPGMEPRPFTCLRIASEEGQEQGSAPHPCQHIWLDMPDVKPMDIIRKPPQEHQPRIV